MKVLARPASAYVHGAEGPVTVVPGRVAGWLESRCGLSRLRIDVRGVDPEVDAVLTALAVAATAWRQAGSEQRTERANSDEPASHSEVMTTTDVADHLGLTDRAVQKALAEGRLQGRKAGRRWLIQREDFAHYLAARAA